MIEHLKLVSPIDLSAAVGRKPTKDIRIAANMLELVLNKFTNGSTIYTRPIVIHMKVNPKIVLTLKLVSRDHKGI